MFNTHYDAFAETGCDSVLSPQGWGYPAPHCAKDFYAAVFAGFQKFTQGTFKSFETDFLSDHLLPTLGMARDPSGLKTYFQGMADAAAGAGLGVQLCMPTAGIVLASQRWPAMTNARATPDYGTEAHPGSTWAKTYNMGIGSLLFWAVGLAPSKDVFWTTTHQPGGSSMQDNPNVELDTAVAVLSTGPVGIGDGLGFTNYTLAKMTASQDGIILKPGKPLTALDSTFIPPRGGHGQTGTVGFLPLMRGASGCDPSKPPGSQPQCSPSADQTHTTLPVSPGNTATWRYLVSIHLGNFVPPARDLLPQPSSAGAPLAAFRELRWPSCTNGTKAMGSACLQPASEASMPNIRSGESYSASGPVPWRMFTLYPSVGNGWIFLGEVGKFVAVSPVRFTTIQTDAACLTVSMEMGDDETVTIGAVSPDGVYLERTVHNGPEGRLCR
jgi:hypothetical protein